MKPLSCHRPPRPCRVLPAFLAGVFALQAADWPQFRGPTGQGLSEEKNPPLRWSGTSNILWKAAIPGESWSSPVIWKKHVLLTTATEGGESCRVLALDADSGKVRWNREVFRQVPRKKEGRNSYATPTPATDGRRVYACFGDGSFAALTLAGELVWTNRSHPFYSQHGLGASPILHDGLLIMTFDGSSEGPDKLVGWQKPWDRSYLVALDTRTGRERWRAPRGLSRISHGTPVLWANGRRPQVVTEAGDVVQGFDARSGERLWTGQVVGEGKVPSPVIGDGMVFTAGGWGGRSSIKAFRLGGSGDLGETSLVWEQRKGMPNVPSMVFQSPYLYAVTDGGIASCLHGADGRLVWQERVGGNFSASPFLADGRLYLLSDEGVTTVLAAGPDYRVLAVNPLGERVQASPALAHGRIYLRTAGHLYCVGR